MSVSKCVFVCGSGNDWFSVGMCVSLLAFSNICMSVYWYKCGNIFVSAPFSYALGFHILSTTKESSINSNEPKRINEGKSTFVQLRMRKIAPTISSYGLVDYGKSNINDSYCHNLLFS